jgi:hypothetical protein
MKHLSDLLVLIGVNHYLLIMRYHLIVLVALECCAYMFFPHTARSQQYNSDNYLSKDYGVATLILTYGQRNTMIMNTYSLFPRWEFTFAAYLYNADKDLATDDGYSLSLYAKYMIYENETKSGGLAVKFGTGLDPGLLDGEDRASDGFKSYWMNVPATIPFFANRVSLDLMPGASVTNNFGQDNKTAWAFTYSTRLAIYPFDYAWAAVGEVYGAEGDILAPPEYRVGIRWEPSQHLVVAATYDDEFKGNNGAGFELGIMIFTPSFAKMF